LFWVSNFHIHAPIIYISSFPVGIYLQPRANLNWPRALILELSMVMTAQIDTRPVFYFDIDNCVRISPEIVLGKGNLPFPFVCNLLR
jgi:hypothetical protein